MLASSENDMSWRIDPWCIELVEWASHCAQMMG